MPAESELGVERSILRNRRTECTCFVGNRTYGRIASGPDAATHHSARTGAERTEADQLQGVGRLESDGLVPDMPRIAPMAPVDVERSQVERDAAL
jgi:hypothetical protein